MVTTDEDNVIRATITKADRLGNITTYVEVGVQKVDSVMTGEDAGRGTLIWPVFLLVVIASGLIAGIVASGGLGLWGIISLLLLTVWMRGAVR